MESSALCLRLILTLTFGEAPIFLKRETKVSETMTMWVTFIW